jgi:hypothetical protein
MGIPRERHQQCHGQTGGRGGHEERTWLITVYVPLALECSLLTSGVALVHGPIHVRLPDGPNHLELIVVHG